MNSLACCCRCSISDWHMASLHTSLLQVIVFALSKRACTDLADKLAQMQVNDEQEAKLVDAIFWSAMDVLPEQDRNLPQVAQALPMLRRGIGVHHSGLLPIVKEAIEVLFSEGLIKVLVSHGSAAGHRTA